MNYQNIIDRKFIKDYSMCYRTVDIEDLHINDAKISAICNKHHRTTYYEKSELYNKKFGYLKRVIVNIAKKRKLNIREPDIKRYE